MLLRQLQPHGYGRSRCQSEATFFFGTLLLQGRNVSMAYPTTLILAYKATFESMPISYMAHSVGKDGLQQG